MFQRIQVARRLDEKSSAFRYCCCIARNGCGLRSELAQQLLVRAIDNLNQGNTEQYKDLVRKAHAKDPNDPFVLNNMGVVAEMEGNLPEAKTYYAQAVEKAGTLKVAKTNKGESQGKLLKDMAAENLKRVSAEK